MVPIASAKSAPIGGVSVLALHQFLIIQAHPTHTPENSRITSYRGGEAGDDDPGGRCGGEEDEGGGGERGESMRLVWVRAGASPFSLPTPSHPQKA